jgi:hypothetical protein
LHGYYRANTRDTPPPARPALRHLDRRPDRLFLTTGLTQAVGAAGGLLGVWLLPRHTRLPIDLWALAGAALLDVALEVSSRTSSTSSRSCRRWAMFIDVGAAVRTRCGAAYFATATCSELARARPASPPASRAAARKWCVPSNVRVFDLRMAR